MNHPRRILGSAAGAVCWLLMAPAWGQIPDTVDSLIAAGNRFLAAQEPDRGQELFEQALEADRERIEAMEGMASADVLRGRWGNGADWYDRILKKNPDHVPALYGFAASKREIGTYTNPLQRYFEWRSSEKHFMRAVQLDSAYKDLLYQYSLLERYRENYENAIGIAHRQLAIHPEIWSGRIGIFRFYDSLIGNRSFDAAESWLKSQPTPYDRYFLGELYRRDNRFDKADSIYTFLLSEPDAFPALPVMLSRVRLLVQKNEPQQANDLYLKAVQSLKNEFDAEFIKQDMIYVLNEKEYQALFRQAPWTAIPEILRAFWFRRDPIPSYSYNYRLIEHYRRLVYAEKNHGYDRFYRSTFLNDYRTTDYFRAREVQPVQFPFWYYANYKLDDIGLIYIRFGEPDDRIRKPGKEAWLYSNQVNESNTIFLFTLRSQGCWLLVPGTSDTLMMQDLINWDSRYYRMVKGSDLDRNSLSHQIVEENARTIETGFHSDRQTWSKDSKVFDFTPSLARFRETGTTDCFQLAYGIPLDKLRAQAADADSIPIETGVEVFNDRLIPVMKDEHRFLVTDMTDSRNREGLFIDEFEFKLPLKPHIIAFHAKVTGEDIVNGWRHYLAPGDSGRDRLACSTLKTAFEIRPAGKPEDRDRKSLVMVPNPLKAGKRGDPLYIYYEVYNLGLDSNGNSQYDADFTLHLLEGRKNLLQQVFGGGGKSSISVRNKRTGKTRNVSDYLGFDVHKAAPGKYELNLKIIDRNTRQESSSTVAVTLY
jgi:tetratricopeptide (TPR) repeat protein